MKFRETAEAGAAAAAAAPLSRVPMRPGAHSFLCCGLLTPLFVSCVMGTELVEWGPRSQQMAPVSFLTLLAPNSGPSCVGTNLGKLCCFSGPAPGSPQWNRQQKQALKCFLQHSGYPQQLLLLCVFLCHENYVNPETSLPRLTLKSTQTACKLWVTSHRGLWLVRLGTLQRTSGSLGCFSGESAGRNPGAWLDHGGHFD